MVPDHISAPDFFGPWDIRSRGILVPAWKYYSMIFMQEPNLSGPKFLGAQIFQVPNSLGTIKARGPNEGGDHFSYSPKGSCPFSSLFELCMSGFLQKILVRSSNFVQDYTQYPIIRNSAEFLGKFKKRALGRPNLRNASKNLRNSQCSDFQS